MKKTKQWQGQLKGYVVEKTIDRYLAERYGGEWTLRQPISVLPPPPPLLIRQIRQGRGGCSMTALTSVFIWLRRKHHLTQLPEAPDALYEMISRIAAGHGFRPVKGRTNPFRLTAIIRRVWRWLDRPGTGRSWLMAGPRRMLRLTGQNQPYLMNIAFGHYGFHTVTVTGCQLWQRKAAGRESRRLLLQVQDGWTTTPRYLDVSAMRRPWSGHFTFYSLTVVRPG